MDTIIRQATLSDLDSLTKIAQKTFIESYADKNDPEDFKRYIDTNLNRTKLKSEVENPDSMFFFGENEFGIHSYLKLNKAKAQTDQRFGQALEIERIYVLRVFQNHNIGSKLIDHSFEIAKQFKLNYVWLGVWDINLAAIRFYQRHNFEIVGNHKFVIGTDVQNDYLMSAKVNHQ